MALNFSGVFLSIILTVHEARGLAGDAAQAAGFNDFALAAVVASEATPPVGTARPAAGTAPGLFCADTAQGVER